MYLEPLYGHAKHGEESGDDGHDEQSVDQFVLKIKHQHSDI